MKLKDFKNTKVMKKEVGKKSFRNACESCLNVNPPMEDGYTVCCNECAVDGQTAMKMAKQEDIQRFLSTKFKDVSSHGNVSSTGKATFVLPTKKKEFTLYLNQTEDYLCNSILTEIKGLRKDV